MEEYNLLPKRLIDKMIDEFLRDDKITETGT
jgi:hypothetical protein